MKTVEINSSNAATSTYIETYTATVRWQSIDISSDFTKSEALLLVEFSSCKFTDGTATISS